MTKFNVGDILVPASIVEPLGIKNQFAPARPIVTMKTKFTVTRVFSGRDLIEVRKIGTSHFTTACPSRFKLYRAAKPGPWGVDTKPVLRVEDAPVREFVIMLRQHGKYLPSPEPKTFGSKSQAMKIAEIMANKHGGRFVVFETVGDAELPEPRKAAVREYR
jgi:hypothetical protein